MGHFIFSFGVKIEKIKSIIGSKNQNLFEEIKEKYSIEDTLDLALKQIINGENIDEEAGSSYRYALIYLCRFVGAKLPYNREIKFGYETDLINEFLHNDFNLRHFELEIELLARNTNIFNLPPVLDWPLMGLLTKNQLAKLKNQFIDILISDEKIEELQSGDDYEQGEAYEHIKGIIQNIDFCLKNELDLISFCH